MVAVSRFGFGRVFPVWWVGLCCVAGCGDGTTPSPDNRTPVAQGAIPSSHLAVGDTTTFDVSQYFSDPDGDLLTYAVSVSPGGIVEASIAGALLELVANTDGEAMVTVTATDAGGLSAEQSFVVVVAGRGDRAVLVALYRATDGPNWGSNANWLTQAPLRQWYGVGGSGDRVTSLRLLANRLSGFIPPALGDLQWLTSLDLGINRLTGPIPPELANLPRLDHLDLYHNSLSGGIPGELGRLTGLTHLRLASNELSGPIPPGLGNLIRLDTLNLRSNALSGAIPPDLGGMTGLKVLDVAGNRLTGAVPPELGRMTDLRELDLTGNQEMEGPLPTEFTDLARLEVLMAGGTGICTPDDPQLLQWLEGVRKQRVPRCEVESGSTAYLVQSVQSRAHPVPLLANVPALLRVFPVAEEANQADLPKVIASFYLDGMEVRRDTIPAKSGPIPTELDEGDLALSANIDVLGEVLRPGLEMVVEIDPDGILDASLGLAKRIPEDGRLPLDVREVPALDLTLIPFLWATNPDSSILDLTRAMSENPQEHEVFFDARTLMPIEKIEAGLHPPVVSSTNYIPALLHQTAAIRTMEGGTGYYMGLIAEASADGAGNAEIGGTSSASIPVSSIVAHELGHNFYLYHAPCGGAPGVDKSYPQTNGTIGAWGYDRHTRELLPPGRPDLMSYCTHTWIGDYHFANALRYRLLRDTTQASPGAGRATASILLWGGRNSRDGLFLEPAFIVDAPPTLPAPGHEYDYRLTGEDTAGRALFSLSFDMRRVADVEGEAGSFAFALPVQGDWADALASITLAGPGGSATLGMATHAPVAILQDIRTGRVRAILREPTGDVSGEAATGAPRPPTGLRLMVSRGIPDGADWGN